MQRAVVLANGHDISPDMLSFKPGHLIDDLPLLGPSVESRDSDSQPVLPLDELENKRFSMPGIISMGIFYKLPKP